MSGVAIALSVTTVVVDTERWTDFCGDERFAFGMGVSPEIVEAMIPDGISSSSLVVAEKEEEKDDFDNDHRLVWYWYDCI